MILTNTRLQVFTWFCGFGKLSVPLPSMKHLILQNHMAIKRNIAFNLSKYHCGPPCHTIVLNLGCHNIHTFIQSEPLSQVNHHMRHRPMSHGCDENVFSHTTHDRHYHNLPLIHIFWNYINAQLKSLHAILLQNITYNVRMAD